MPGCLHPTSSDDLLILAGIVATGFSRLRATHSLANCGFEILTKLYSLHGHLFRPEVTNMRPAKEFPVAHKHFDETRVFELSYPHLIFAMRYQKLSTRLNHARITQESNTHIIQYKLSICFRIEQFIHCMQ